MGRATAGKQQRKARRNRLGLDPDEAPGKRIKQKNCCPNGQQFLLVRRILLDFDGSADSLELSLEGLGIFLGNAFLDLGGDTLDQTLGLGQA